MTTTIQTQVTPALLPENLKQIEGYDDKIAPILTPTLTAFDEAYQGIAKVHEARERAKTNPTWNKSMQVIHTQDLADKVFARIAKGVDSTRANLEKGIAHVEQELSQPVGSEIRTYVRGLDTAKLHDFIQKAIDNGDHNMVTAVLGAPSHALLSDLQAQAVARSA
jgi:hypothetical protein